LNEVSFEQGNNARLDLTIQELVTLKRLALNENSRLELADDKLRRRYEPTGPTNKEQALYLAHSLEESTETLKNYSRLIVKLSEAIEKWS